MSFNSIYLRKCYGGKVKKVVSVLIFIQVKNYLHSLCVIVLWWLLFFGKITVQKPVKEGQEETVDLDLEQTNCEVCGGSDREDRLLLCDGCDAG